jgi:hypothetical protein
VDIFGHRKKFYFTSTVTETRNNKLFYTCD